MNLYSSNTLRINNLSTGFELEFDAISYGTIDVTPRTVGFVGFN